VFDWCNPFILYNVHLFADRVGIIKMHIIHVRHNNNKIHNCNC